MYHSYQSLPSKGWEKSDTLFFHIPISDSLRDLHLSVEVRNESNYPYQDLYLFVSHNLQDSITWSVDTVMLTLANKEGKWLGTGWGSLYQSATPMKSVVTKHPGNYTFKVTHGMKDNNLQGINDIGIKIE